MPTPEQERTFLEGNLRGTHAQPGKQQKPSSTHATSSPSSPVEHSVSTFSTGFQNSLCDANL